jgi:hypothetical protein
MVTPEISAQIDRLTLRSILPGRVNKNAEICSLQALS